MSSNISSLSTEQDDEIDLRQYLQIFSKYKFKIATLTILILILSVLISLSLTPIYRSSAKLLLESNSAKVVSIEEVYGLSSSGREYYQTQLEVIKSREIAEKVFNKLSIDKHPEYRLEKKPSFFQQLGLNLDWLNWLPVSWQPNSQADDFSPEKKRSKALDNFIGNLDIQLLRNTQVLLISFESSDPELAAQVPNVVADTFIENDLLARLEMTKRASSWLMEQMDGLRTDLEKSEQALQDYMQANQLVDVAGVKSIAADQLGALTSDLVSARTKLAQAASAYRQVRNSRHSPKALLSVPAILNNSLVQRLRELELEKERKVSELKKRYGDKHPQMIAAKTELASAKENTLSQVREVASSIEKEYQLAQAAVNALEGSKDKIETQVQTISSKEYQLEALKREVKTNRELYDMFLSRLKETNVSQQNQESTIGRVIDKARPQTLPSKPKKSLIVLIASILGFLFSTLLAFLLEHLDNSLHSGDDVESKTGLPLLGILPKLKNSTAKANKNPPHLTVFNQPDSQFSESIRTVRTGILLSALDNPHKVVVITSSVAAEGKTTFAVNQALALGQMHKTVLIEADMRRPSIGRMLGFTPDLPGLSDLTAGVKEFDECIHSLVRAEDTPEQQIAVDFIPSGLVPPNPLDLLSSKRFQHIMQVLAERYEQIIIDCPPVHAVSDAVVMAKYASAVIYVVKSDDTPYQLVQTGIKKLEQAKTPILGIILNQANIAKHKYYGNYNAYYGYGYSSTN